MRTLWTYHSELDQTLLSCLEGFIDKIQLQVLVKKGLAQTDLVTEKVEEGLWLNLVDIAIEWRAQAKDPLMLVQGTIYSARKG